MTILMQVIKSQHTSRYLNRFCPGCGYDYTNPISCGRRPGGICAKCGGSWRDFDIEADAVAYYSVHPSIVGSSAVKAQKIIEDDVEEYKPSVDTSRKAIADDHSAIAARMRQLGLRG